MIDSDNDLSSEEICDRFQKEFSVEVSVTAMHESLKRLGISRKKSCHDPKKGSDITGYFIGFSTEKTAFLSTKQDAVFLTACISGGTFNGTVSACYIENFMFNFLTHG